MSPALAASASLTERLNGILSRALQPFGFEAQTVTTAARLIDEEGDTITALSAAFVSAVSDVDNDDALALLTQVYVAHCTARDRAFHAGQASGRQSVIDGVHELLGIRRLVGEAEKIREAVELSGRPL